MAARPIRCPHCRRLRANPAWARDQDLDAALLARLSEDATTLTQTIVVKLVGEGASSASAKDGANGDDMIFFGDILMNDVIREAGKGKTSAGEKDFDFVGGREFPDALERCRRLVL